jgi:HlyD family secretion protein
MRKWISLIIIVVLIFASIFSISVIWSAKNKSINNPVSVVAVQKGTITEKAEAIGYIEPLHSSTVKSSISGSVAKIYHHEGEYVHKGDLLLEVKPEPEPADYATTYANLKEATATYVAAQKNLARYNDAFQRGLISANYTEYINAQKDYKNSKEQRLLAEQKLALLEKGLTKVGNKPLANTVISPIDGYILTREVDVGDPVISLSSAQSATALYTIADMHDLMFKGSVDEIDASKINLHMPAAITVGASSKLVIYGELSRISLQSEQKAALTSNNKPDGNLPFNVSFKVEITDLKIPPGLILRSGYSATADIKIRTKENILILPERVLHFKDENHAYVLLPELNKLNKKTKPKEQPVTIGLTDGILAEITSGLALNDKVLDKPDIQSDNE